VSRRPLATVLVALALAFAAASASEAETGSRAAAAALVAQAAAARAAGDAASALDLVRRALELSPWFSDALSLRASIRLADRATTREALEDLRRAVASASWDAADADEASLALGQTLLRTRHADEAIPLLEDLAGRRPADSRPLAALADAYRAAGRMDAARAAYAQGRARFPAEAAFVLGLSGMLAEAGRTDDAFAIVDAAVADSPSDTGLQLRRAELESDPAQRVADVERALAAGSRDPLAAVLALESRPPAESAKRFLGLFLSDGGLASADLADRAARAIARDPALAQELEQAVSRYTGSRELDRDGDGWWEERWEFADGAMTRWIRDADQDGAREYDAVLDAGRPVSLAYDGRPQVRFTLAYGVYPWIATVAESGPEGARTWTLANRALDAPFLGPSVPRVPTPAEVERAAVRLEEAAAPGRGVRRIDMQDGMRRYLEEDADGDGAIDHRLWYADGVPVRGARDLAGDGDFEAVETWTGGTLARLSVDTDGDGRFDYGETYQPSARLWDYNEDGRDDSRETSDGKGGFVREFSTRADGRFDLRILFRDGAIVEVTRSGRPVAATADPTRGVTWIGAAPKSAAVDVSREGYRTFGGREYLVFTHAGVVYVEALP
jgi:tetratricopeptide (TPR) repeat protein